MIEGIMGTSSVINWGFVMINLYDILKSANGQLFGEPVAQLFTDFCFDASRAKASMMFVALQTPQGDSHYDIPEAIRNGVSGILCHEPPTYDTNGVTVVIVKDALDTLMAWSHYVLGRMGARTIAVGGTSGKSVAVKAISAVLGLKYSVHQGNLDVDGRLNIPLTVAKMQPDTKYVVFKLSPTAPSDMAELVQACQPHIAVINHIDTIQSVMFRDSAQLIDEHAILLDGLAPSDLTILNFDEDTTREFSSRTRSRIKTIGIDNFGADMMARNVVIGAERTGFDIHYEDNREVGRWSPILGKHQLYGLLSALLIGVELGVPLDDALRAISQIENLPGRMRPLAGKNGSTIIDDTFHANTHSTIAALDWLAEVKAEGQRAIFVMGDLDNLGASSQFAHRAIGTRAAKVADNIVTFGTEAAIVGRAAIDQQMPAYHIRMTYGVKDVISAVEDLGLNSNDVVLVKGGASARIEAVVRGLLADPANVNQLVRQDENETLADMPIRSLRPSWTQIDGDALANNVRVLKSILAPDATLMAIVKANGYGHGAVLTARTALANGAGYIGVANMAEAMELRDAGITAPILVLTYMPTHAVRQAVAENITATVFDLNIAQQYDRVARSTKGRLKVHVKIDTGMGRLGILANDAINAFRHLNSYRHLDIEGIYTHFATADESKDFTNQQVDAFKNVIRFLRAGGFQFKYIHAANSPATLLGQDYHFNMVRTGVVMYGLNPSRIAPLPSGIQPALAWKTTVLQVKQLPKGHSVGYGRAYTTKTTETIAILPVGYADGLRRSPQTWREVLVHGKRAPLIGRVSMEKCAINVTHIEGISPGDEVVLLGKQGFDRITAEEIGDWLGTINYEVTTTLQPRQ
jgi:Alr-MurF fusion protein